MGISSLIHVTGACTRESLKEKISERYPGEVNQGISRCIEHRSITWASVGIQCTGDFADKSGRKL